MRKKWKKGITLVELVVVMAVSVIAIGMILSMTVAISTQLENSKRTEGITSELSLIRSAVGERKTKIISGAMTFNYDTKTKFLTFTNVADSSKQHVKLFYLSSISIERHYSYIAGIQNPTSDGIQLTMNFTSPKSSQVFHMLFPTHI